MDKGSEWFSFLISPLSFIDCLEYRGILNLIKIAFLEMQMWNKVIVGTVCGKEVSLVFVFVF